VDHPGPSPTGERTLPGIPHENYWFRRHEAAYLFALARLRTGPVLDAGCGEGFGTRILSRRADLVEAIDFDAAAAAHAQGRYQDERIHVRQGDVANLPYPDAHFAGAVFFQVIEHLPDQPRAVAELARVLRPGGVLVCSTPNRLTFSPGRDAPLNPFHTREFNAAELAELLGLHFRVKGIYGSFHGRRLRMVEGLARTDLPSAQLAGAPEQWPAWLRLVVRRVRASHFRFSTHDVERSLDLVAVARKAPA